MPTNRGEGMPDEPLEQMKRDFINESLEAVEKIYNDLGGFEPSQAGAEGVVNALFRKAHSLKGTAGMFDLVDVGMIAAEIENVLEEVRSGRMSLGPEVMDVVFDGLDEIVLLLREARGEAVDADAGAAVSRVKAFLAGDRTAIPAGDALAQVKHRLPAGSLDHLMPWETDELVECARSGKRIVHLSIALNGMSFTDVAIRVLPELDPYGRVLGVPPPLRDENGQAAFALIFVVDSDGPGFDAYVRQKGGSLVEALAVVGEEASADGAGGGPEPAARGRAGGESRRAMAVKVDIARLDSVMNTISELYGVRFKLAEAAGALSVGAAGRKERDELLKLGLLLSRHITEIETAVMEARLVPVSMLFNRYVSEIRRLARKQGKEIDLVLEGEGTRMDRALLEEIYDPVLHLIRNAVDHGVEAGDARLRQGKPEKGRITLRARQESNHVRIDVQDDGRGLDFEKIEKIAHERGLTQLSEDDLVDLLFEPGVSTSGEVTEISGRGVGLDEVKVHVESLRGMVSVRSTPGRGTCFSLLIPLTLAVSRGVVFEEGRVTAVLPLSYVEEIIPYRGRLVREIEATGAARTKRHGKVEAFDLAGVLGTARQGPPRSLVIVALGDVRYAITVERVWGETDIAMRPLPESMQAPALIAGATELHDRRPAVIVQPEPLFRSGSSTGGGLRGLSEFCPGDAGLAGDLAGEETLKMGLFETPLGRLAVPISLLKQVVPARPVLEVPALGAAWNGIFFERGLCHGLVRLGDNGGAAVSKIALLRFPERCGVAVTRVIGEVEVPREKIETSGAAPGTGPVGVAAAFALNGERVGVLDLNRAWGEEGQPARAGVAGSANARTRLDDK
jgi:two-component system chemotaxis sensor kinase CheA